METYEDLGAVLGPVDLDSEALIARAVRDGRRHERRRRLGVGVGAVAVVAVSVGAGLHGGGSHQPDGGAVADPGATDQGTGLPSPEVADARLSALLPVPGDPLSATSGGSAAEPFVRVQRSLDPDGSGTGTVLVELVTGKPLSPADILHSSQKCSLVAGRAGSAESCTRLADGWMFTVTTRPDGTQASARAVEHIANVTFEDGTIVDVLAANYVHASDPTRDTPVLTMAEVQKLATDPVWFQSAP
ncbi:hypothetical protein [Nocardioides cynanchi]|uniref:hypothetical protein n=1 Tax=Nocardioides cynanchi TaxID=2558918 RepID=UPI001248651F|nr:hypothetical protein [Nocardioides cynanchi]